MENLGSGRQVVIDGGSNCITFFRDGSGFEKSSATISTCVHHAAPRARVHVVSLVVWLLVSGGLSRSLSSRRSSSVAAARISRPVRSAIAHRSVITRQGEVSCGGSGAGSSKGQCHGGQARA